MSMLASVLLLVAQQDQSYFHNITNGTELVMAFMVHRHGDRTPTTDAIPLSNNPEELEELIRPYGYGQLTKRGIKRSYDLGKFIRRRYNDILPSKYNRSDIFLRSTESTRAKMTLLAAMAAVFPPNDEDKWESELNWTPTPYTVIPAKYDYNLALLSCPTFANVFDATHSTNTSKMEGYDDVIRKLNTLGYNVTSNPWKVFLLYDLFISELGLGVPLDPDVKDIFPRLKEAAGKAWDDLFGNDEYTSLASGVLLNEFFDSADAAISGKPAQKIRIQAGHDVTVYPLIAATKVRPRPSPIGYTALYSLELRKVVKTGKYVVLPVFLGDPENQEQYLQVEGCDDLLCDFDRFKNITSPYVLTEPEWKRLCKFDENAKINTSSVD